LIKDLAEQLISTALRGDDASWPAPQPPDFAAVLDERARYHGVETLLHEVLNPEWHWPAALREGLRTAAIAQTMYELRHQAVLTRVIAALSDAGIDALVIKGTALAYSVYPKPFLRRRGDTDLFIPERQRSRTGEVLASLGFELGSGVSGDFISYQATYTLRSPDGSRHDLDVHWKINNSQVLSRIFTYQELRERAVPLPALAPGAVAHDPVDALLLSCMHRASHINVPYYVDGTAHLGGDRMIWLYDIRLIAHGLDVGQWKLFAERAKTKGLCAACLNGLETAHLRLAMVYPSAVKAELEAYAGQEAASRYLSSGIMRQTCMDFLALDSRRQQLRFAKEYTFPPASYMAGKYAGARFSWPPWLYVRRLGEGVVKRIPAPWRLMR
jgi:hypothetical protein